MANFYGQFIGFGASGVSGAAVSHQQGSLYGYQSGGSPASNIITKFTFASHGDTSDVGNLTVAVYMPAGSSSPTYGFTNGGYSDSGQVNTISTFAFASDGDASDHGDLHSAQSVCGGASSVTYGYTTGGISDSNVIQKYAFSSNTTGTDVGNLLSGRRVTDCANSATYGYALGGNAPNKITIDKFAFASDGDATDQGDLGNTGRRPVAAEDLDYGYAAGGGDGTETPPGAWENVIERFAFASTGNSVDVGDLSRNGWRASGCSSQAGYGYYAGGYIGSYMSGYDQYALVSSGNGTEVGNLASPRSTSVHTTSEHTGHQY